MMSREQLATVKSRIEAELRAVEANPKSTKQVKDRVAKLLGKASACLEQVCCAELLCPSPLSPRSSSHDTSAACHGMHP